MRSLIVASATDPSGMSGLAQDVRVAFAAGVHALVVATGVTSQGRRGVSAVQPTPPALLESQWRDALPLLSRPRAVKVGLVPTLPGARALVRLVAESKAAAVIDTPFLASWGGRLTKSEPASIAWALAPCAALLTPNADEAAALSGIRIRDEAGMLEAAEALVCRGVRAVLVKGGHLSGDPVDLLVTPEYVRSFRRPRSRRKPRGTGCALSTLVAAKLALGMGLPDAVGSAEVDFALGLPGVEVARGARAFDAASMMEPGA